MNGGALEAEAALPDASRTLAERLLSIGATNSLEDVVRRIGPADLDVDLADPLRSMVRGQAERTCRGRASHAGMLEAVVRRVLARPDAISLLAAIESARPWIEATGRAEDVWCWALGLDVALWCATALAEAEADRNRRAVAMPSTRDSHHVHRALGGRVSKALRLDGSDGSNGAVRLVIPGYESAQLELPLSLNDGGLLGALFPALAKSKRAAQRGREGELWSAYLGLHVLWSANGHRAAVWTLTEHMRRLGCSESEMRDHRARARAQDVVRALLRAALVQDRPGGGEDRIYLATLLGERTGPDGHLDGAVIGPGLLYEGVRRVDGRLGSEHVWLPPSVAALPPRLSLALALSADRAQWAHRSGKPAVAPWTSRKLADAMGVGRVRDLPLDDLRGLSPEHGTWTVEGDTVTWHPPGWVADRILGVTPIEPLGVLVDGLPATGAELRAWRETRKMTQADLAERVGVRRETVMRWESRGEDAIPPAARTKLQASADPAHRKKQRPKRKPKPRG